MTDLDRVLAEVAAAVERLPTRAMVALFAACAHGLKPAFSAWAAVRQAQADTEGLLEDALAVAFLYAREGAVSRDLADLLRLLEAATPPGESPDSVSSTVAQDCWICADTAIRTVVDPAFEAAPVISYALEPIIQATTERLFGVSDVGSGPSEEASEAAVLGDARVQGALEFVRWGLEHLQVPGGPDDRLFGELQARSRALLP